MRGSKKPSMKVFTAAHPCRLAGAGDALLKPGSSKKGGAHVAIG